MRLMRACACDNGPMLSWRHRPCGDVNQQNELPRDFSANEPTPHPESSVRCSSTNCKINCKIINPHSPPDGRTDGTLLYLLDQVSRHLASSQQGGKRGDEQALSATLVARP